MMLWQVPVGNQYFDTENNTNDNYQDNRPEHIFGHIIELIHNGIIGAVFAPGNAGNTSYTDLDNDVVVNPPSFCITDTISSGQIWNNHTATVSDDDGGFIRMSAQSHYSSWQVATSATLGSYTVKIGVFTPGCGKLLNWNNGAATVTVASATSSATNTSVPTNTPSAAPANTATAVPSSTSLPTSTPTSTPTVTSSPAPTPTPKHHGKS